MKKLVLLLMGILMMLGVSACGTIRDSINDAATAATDTAEANRNSVSANDNSALVGRWEFVSGDMIYYFHEGADIEFYADGRVIEYAFDEPGRFEVLGDGRMSAIGDWINELYYFSYSISGNTLTITDHDGDRAVWTRPSPGTAERASDPTTDDNELIGRWEFVSGQQIYYFDTDGDIEFYADGRVMEYSHGEPGRFEVLGNGRMSAIGEWFNELYFFDYTISDNTLTIIDSDGDRGTWRRR
jgi:hypothetical protein